MPDYINNRSYDLHLTDEYGNKKTIRRGKRVTLSEYFDIYVAKKLLIKAESRSNNQPIKVSKIQQPIQQPIQQQQPRRMPAKPQSKPAEIKTNKRPVRLVRTPPDRTINQKSPTVGITDNTDIYNKFEGIKSEFRFNISNNIGIGILSYNRPASLKRLIDSITKYTDLNKTTVFISDDASDNSRLISYLNSLSNSGPFCVLLNNDRAGVAGNSNRLLQCLSRFKYKLLLNDDVEILKSGWDKFYFDKISILGIHHFCYRQPRIYGASIGENKVINGINVNVVNDKPHGAVLAFDDIAYDTVGYFDEKFGIYGVEHVDWSERISKSNIQPPGYYDLQGSDKYFRIHNEKSAIEGRTNYLKSAKNMTPTNKLTITDTKFSVPSISCIIPCRDTDRHEAILTVVDNIRAQRFPNIDIILAEQDVIQHFQPAEIYPANYVYVNADIKHFNKSKAFNMGISKAKYDRLLLHDADTIAPSNYVAQVYNILNDYESCHICNRVYYADDRSTNYITTNKNVDKNVSCHRLVTYFEGGSLACYKDTYWRVGGFYENFWGYGVEDCDFYYRLSHASKWYGNRSFPLVHLFHGRTSGWEQCHEENKKIGAELEKHTLEKRISLSRKLLASNSNLLKSLEQNGESFYLT